MSWTRGNVIFLVFLLIVAVLIGMPYLLQRRRDGRRLLCEKRQMEAARAILRFEAATGRYPGFREVRTRLDNGQPSSTSWAFPMLPYLGIRYEPEPKVPIKEDERIGPWKNLHEKFGKRTMTPDMPAEYIHDLVCPSDPTIDPENPQPWTSFVVNSGCPDVAETDALPPDWWANGVGMDMLSQHATKQYVSLARLKESDGAGATLLISENVDAGLWTSGQESQVGFVWVDHLVDGKPDPGDRLYRINQAIGEGDDSPRFARPSSRHQGGVNVAYCDGRTAFLSEEIDYRAFCYQMTSYAAQAREPGTTLPVEAPYLVKE